MAQLVRIINVNGNNVQTADGRTLRIIGNAKPGRFGWTDGKVLYGYAIPGGYNAPVLRKKRFPFLVRYNNGGTFYDVFTRNGQQFPVYAKCPPRLWWKNRIYDCDGTYIYENGQVLYDLASAYVMYFRDRKFDFQAGDYCPTLSADMWYWYGGQQFVYHNPKMPIGMADSRTGNLRNLSFISKNVSDSDPSLVANGNVAGNNNVAGIVTQVLAELQDEMPVSTGPAQPAWFAFVMTDNSNFQYPAFPMCIAGAAESDGGARRFKRIGDTEIIFWIDVVGITYRPQFNEPWWPLGCRFRVCVKTDLSGKAYLYKRVTRHWLNEIGYDGYEVLESDTVIIPETAYDVDLGEGYAWNSADHRIYKDNQLFSNDAYTEVKGIYRNHILAQKESDSLWYFDNEMILYQPYGWDFIDQFCVQPEYE